MPYAVHVEHRHADHDIREGAAVGDLIDIDQGAFTENAHLGIISERNPQLVEGLEGNRGPKRTKAHIQNINLPGHGRSFKRRSIKVQRDQVVHLQPGSHLLEGNQTRCQSGSGIRIDVSSIESVGGLTVLQPVSLLLDQPELRNAQKSGYVGQCSVIGGNDILPAGCPGYDALPAGATKSCPLTEAALSETQEM